MFLHHGLKVKIRNVSVYLYVMESTVSFSAFRINLIEKLNRLVTSERNELSACMPKEWS